MDRSVRWLVAWMNEADAINSLLGHVPRPEEDISSQRDLWTLAQRAKSTGERYHIAAPIIEPVPDELSEQSTAFSRRDDVVATFHGLEWQVGMVDLDQVLSFQKAVIEEQALERVDSGVDVNSPKSIFSFCLPTAAEEASLQGALDLDQRGITFGSLNPNLRVGGQFMVEVEVSPAPGEPSVKQKLVGFTVTYGAPFVQVAEYNGRWFVRDGYHRCYGLLRRGVTKIPCVFIRAKSLEEVGAARPGFFTYEVLFGDRPPFVKDFLDDSMSATAKQPALRKIVRLQAEEFVVAV